MACRHGNLGYKCPECARERAAEAVAAQPTLPAPPMLGRGIAGIEDIEAYFNMRKWLQDACEAKGAKMTGGGVGGGQADIDIELEGHHYNISIRPLRRG